MSRKSLGIYYGVIVLGVGYVGAFLTCGWYRNVSYPGLKVSELCLVSEEPDANRRLGVFFAPLIAALSHVRPSAHFVRDFGTFDGLGSPLGISSGGPLWRLVPQNVLRWGYALAASLLLGPVAWHWSRRRRRRPGPCKKCGYDLPGNTSGVCSECGAPVLNRAGRAPPTGAPDADCSPERLSRR